METTKIARILYIGMCSANIWAQQGTVTSGGTASGGNGNISYSLGQTIYTTNSNGTGANSQGIQQPYEIFTLGTDDFIAKNLKMSLYPNPTVNFITLKMESFASNSYEYNLFDMMGKTILYERIQEVETEICLDNLPSSTYFLNVLNNKKIIKSFKIIKTN